MDLPYSVDYRITSKCNHKCSECYGPKNVNELNTIQSLELLKYLKKKEIKRVVITGGDPLLRDDIDEILKNVKLIGLELYFVTSGYNYFSHKKVIDENSAYLSLPLNSTKDNRKKNIINILESYNKDKKPFIKLGSVVSTDNYGNLDELGELLSNYPIDLWILYELIPVKNISKTINLNQLQEKKQELSKKISKFDIKITPRFRTKNYFMINPDATIILPYEKKGVYNEEIVGNLFDEDIFKKWQIKSKELNSWNWKTI
jgi:MoaA/NifB/PqqE/SkfB family radical SAM enzyme